MTMYHDVVTRAHTDADYRKRLIDTPRDALAEMGIVVPDDIEIHITESEPNSLTIALPSTDAELPSETLAAVAGGRSDFWTVWDYMFKPPR